MDILEKKRFSIIIAAVGSFVAVTAGLGSFTLYREISNNPDALHTHINVRTVMPLVPYAGIGIAVIYFFLVVIHLRYYYFVSKNSRTPNSRSIDSFFSEMSSSFFKNLYDKVFGSVKPTHYEPKLSESSLTGSVTSIAQSPTKTAEQVIEKANRGPQSPSFHPVQPSDSAFKMGVHPATTLQQQNTAQLKTSQYTSPISPQLASATITEQKFEPTLSHGPDVIQSALSLPPQRTEGKIVQRSYPMQGAEKTIILDTHQPQRTEQIIIQGTKPTTMQGAFPVQETETRPKQPDLHNYNLMSTENSINAHKVKNSYSVPYRNPDNIYAARFNDRNTQFRKQTTHEIIPQNVAVQGTEPLIPQSPPLKTHSSIIQATDPTMIQSNDQNIIKHTRPLQQICPASSIPKSHGLFGFISTNPNLAPYKSPEKEIHPHPIDPISPIQGRLTPNIQTCTNAKVQDQVSQMMPNVCQSMPMVQGQSVPAMQSQSMPMVQGQSIPTMQNQGMPMVHGRASSLNQMMQNQVNPMMQANVSQMVQGEVHEPIIQNREFSCDESESTSSKQVRVALKKRTTKLLPKHMKKGKEPQKEFGKVMPKRIVRSSDDSQTSELLPSGIIQPKGDRFVSPVSSSLESKLLPGQGDNVCGMLSTGKTPITYTEEVYDNAKVAAASRRCSTFGYWKAKAQDDEKLEIYELQSHGN